MSGPDYWQQQELEEMQQQLEASGINPSEFVDGQNFARKGKPIPSGSSSSFIRGYRSEKGMDEVNEHLRTA